MFLSMNHSNYMSNRNRFKDIGTFLLKKSLMRSQSLMRSMGESSAKYHDNLDSNFDSLNDNCIFNAVKDFYLLNKKQFFQGQRSWCQMKDYMHVPIYES